MMMMMMMQPRLKSRTIVEVSQSHLCAQTGQHHCNLSIIAKK